MAETSKINIKSLPVTTEVKIGDYIILETDEGTRLLDFEDFVVTEYNTTFHPSISTNTADILTNTTNVAALSTALSGTNTTLRISSTAVSVSALGIGTHATTCLLDITSATTNADICIDAFTNSDARIYFRENGSTVFKIYTDNSETNNPLKIYDYVSASDMVTFVNGNVGIGTGSPTQVLHVSGAGTSIGAAITTSDNSGTPSLTIGNGEKEFYIKIDGTDSNSFKLYDNTSTSSRLTIDTLGNVSVGNVTPATTLHVGSISACMTLDANTGTPPTPDASSQGRIYMKGGKLVIQYNDAGTIRYKYLNMIATGVTWVHTTTAP